MYDYYAYYQYKNIVGTPNVEQKPSKHFSMPSFIRKPIVPQKLIFELRSENGLPLEAPLQISQIVLSHNNNPICEYVLPNMYESPIHFYVQHAPFQMPKTINILHYGAVFCNGYIVFDIPTYFSIKDLSLTVVHRSQDLVGVNVFMLTSTKEHYFGKITVTKPYHWETIHLKYPGWDSEEKEPSYEDILINKVACVNNEDEELSIVKTNEPISIEIEYTTINKSLFENIQLLIVLRNEASTKEYPTFTQKLRFNPLVAKHTIVTPIDTYLPPGDYSIVLFVAKQPYAEQKTITILPITPDAYQLIQKPLYIKVVEPLETEETTILETSTINIFYYN